MWSWIEIVSVTLAVITLIVCTGTEDTEHFVAAIWLAFLAFAAGVKLGAL